VLLFKFHAKLGGEGIEPFIHYMVEPLKGTVLSGVKKLVARRLILKQISIDAHEEPLTRCAWICGLVDESFHLESVVIPKP
jgi:hypothetical protein